MITISKDPNENWENDQIQFPRLIAEAEGLGLFTEEAIANLAMEMGLEISHVEEILDRAQNAWSEIALRT